MLRSYINIMLEDESHYWIQKQLQQQAEERALRRQALKKSKHQGDECQQQAQEEYDRELRYKEEMERHAASRQQKSELQINATIDLAHKPGSRDGSRFGFFKQHDRDKIQKSKEAEKKRAREQHLLSDHSARVNRRNWLNRLKKNNEENTVSSKLMRSGKR